MNAIEYDDPMTGAFVGEDVLPFRRILVPVDLDEISEAALRMAATIAASSGAELHILHVIVPEDHDALRRRYVALDHDADDPEVWIHRAAARIVGDMARRALPPGQGYEILTRIGFPADVIFEIIESEEAVGADLVVMGTHGRHGVRRMTLGSVAERIVRDSSVPVLVVRGEAE